MTYTPMTSAEVNALADLGKGHLPVTLGIEEFNNLIATVRDRDSELKRLRAIITKALCHSTHEQIADSLRSSILDPTA